MHWRASRQWGSAGHQYILDGVAVHIGQAVVPAGVFECEASVVDAQGMFRDFARITTAQISPILPYLLLVLMLIFRPRGMFGTRDV